MKDGPFGCNDITDDCIHMKTGVDFKERVQVLIPPAFPVIQARLQIFIPLRQAYTGSTLNS
jgi:hypothetical protein